METLSELITRYHLLSSCESEIKEATELLIKTFENGNRLYICGNGGSAADADHIVGELMKGFMSHRTLNEDEIKMFDGIAENPAEFAKYIQNTIPAISLPSQTAVISAFANDVNPDMVYAQLAFGYGRENDLIFCLSTSGNSKNVVNAAIAAKARKMKTVALTGAKESKLSAICDVTLKAPSTETYIVQEYHLPMYHYLCAELEKRLFK